jgi:sphingolipid 4-desaturase/C4-monooxygenase
MEPVLLNQKKEKPPGVFENTNFNKRYDKFHEMIHDEPHVTRRKQIIAAHPEVKELFQTDRTSLVVLVLIIVVHFTILYYVKSASWPVYLLSLYCIGATLCHSTQALVHDLTHFTCFESVILNKLTAILCNLPNGIPSAISFGRYHKDHHVYMNIRGIDSDLPTDWEIRTFNTPLRKLFFLVFLPFFYAIRPFFIRPKSPESMEILNMVIIFSTDYIIYRLWGPAALAYMILSGLVGMGLHPCSMHVIAEHYEFVNGQETFSYYGVLNYPNLNLGYHTEHHDFPNIPWRLLPKLKEMAPEFYNNLPHHYSYVEVALRFLMDPAIGPWSRIVRKPSKLENDELKKKEK